MARCRECKRKFPPDMITSLVTNHGSSPMCPICALVIRNTMHGLPIDTPFSGEIASNMHDDAVEHLAKTGQTDPRVEI